MTGALWSGPTQLMKTALSEQSEAYHSLHALSQCSFDRIKATVTNLEGTAPTSMTLLTCTTQRGSDMKYLPDSSPISQKL